MAYNPFAAREVRTTPAEADAQVWEAPTYAVPQHGEYGVPSLEAGSPYSGFGWAGGLRTSPSTVETPSAQRLRTIEPDTFYPQPNKVGEFYGRRDADDKSRHSVEKIDADGWTEAKGVMPNDRRWADNPRITPQPETRNTQQMAPTTYNFTRPFDQGYARTFNGTHFSMADHRRNYEVMGMAPVTSRRNTFRQEPVPWDTDIVDMPANAEPELPYARYSTPEVPLNRNWRLI